MAHMHHGRKHPDSTTKRCKKHKNWLVDLEALATLMLADAEDDEEEMAAILVAQIAVKEAHLLHLHSVGCYGHRGLYDSQKSKDFFLLLLYNFSDRWFKSWMRFTIISFCSICSDY